MSDNQKVKKSTLIDELDSLKNSLNSGPEHQHAIPTLDEPYRAASPHDINDFFDDHDLDVPILTDPVETVSPEALSLEIDHIAPYQVSASPENMGIPESTEAHENEYLSSNSQPQLFQPCHSHENNNKHDFNDPSVNNHNSIDLNKLSEETDSSLIELDHVLDELVAEQLPKLEQQLREKLRHELEPDLETSLESQMEQKVPSSKA
jgi:hypothetical protein